MKQLLLLSAHLRLHAQVWSATSIRALTCLVAALSSCLTALPNALALLVLALVGVDAAVAGLRSSWFGVGMKDDEVRRGRGAGGEPPSDAGASDLHPKVVGREGHGRRGWEKHVSTD